MKDDKWIRGYIERSEAKYGVNRYKYIEYEYRNKRRYVRFLCVKHNCEFMQEAREHLKGSISCCECIAEKHKRKPNGYWTYEKCYEIAKRYEWLSEFIKKHRSCYTKSKKNDWLKDFTWLKRNYEQDENILTSQKHCIYKYEFLDRNCVYIGLTMNLKQRHRGHTKEGSVYKFCKTNNLKIPQPKIVESGLTIETSGGREQFWIDYYKDNGWMLLNRKRGGDIGGFELTSVREKEFLKKSQEKHNGKYQYDRVKYEKRNKKVEIICPKHGIFTQTPRNHLHGHGCPVCSGNNRKSQEEFVEHCNKVHNNRYNYSEVKYVSQNKKIIILCPLHGRFEQLAKIHYEGHGCPKCSDSKRNNNRRLTKEQFIIKSKQIHGGKYDYSKVEYRSLRKKVCIVCPEHGEFWQLPSSHLSGRKCLGCSGSKKKTTKEFILKAKQVHGDTYNYSKVVYNGLSKAIDIICPKHGLFQQNAKVHLRGHGCPKCGVEEVKKRLTMTTEEFVNRSKEVWGENTFDYSDTVYINGRTKVSVRCIKHDKVCFQKPIEHYNGHNPCKLCCCKS